MEKLKLDYIDLYLIHAPFSKDNRLEQWKALSELRQVGKAKSIGVCNYNKSQIEQIKAAGLPLPDANQIELHPWSQKNSLVSYLIENEIFPIAYSSLVPLSEWRAVEGEDRIRQNINVFSFEIDNEDMQPIENMERGAGIAWASGDPSQVP